YSEETQRYVDEESARMVAGRYEAVKRLIDRHRDELEALARALLEREVVERGEIERIVGDPETGDARRTGSPAT
ncbi:MAG: hypothetical protein ACOC2D_17000, partial [Spirochaetota bacterium]